ncbi:MAG: DUF308 domain-containing protein [Nitrososphaerota archaeon]|jgi:uncharacterized membrane protein HdeD (DUF308 family)|nr:DUF308 domain-containing protein [Nitrososphaerota archaeon]
MTNVVDNGLKKIGFNVSKPVLAIICIIFGVVLFIWPDLAGIVIGVFLLVQGIILLVEYYSSNKTLNASHYA